MKKIMAVCLICLLSLSLSLTIFSSALAQGDPGSTNKITLQYLLNEPTVDRGAVKLAGPDGSGEIYDSVTIPGLNNRIVPGEPILPLRTARILIPYGEEVQEVKVVAGNEKYLGTVSIRPGQNSVPIGFTENCTGCNPEDNWTMTPELSLLNEEIYESESPYPEVAYSVLGVFKKHGYNILYVNLYPIKYIPKTGEAYSFGAFDIEVTTAPAETLDRGLFRGLPEDREEVDMIVDNPEKTTTYASDLALTGKSLLLDGNYTYVIITNQYMKDAPGPYNFQALADHKISKGVPAAIVTVEEIYAAYKYTFHRDNQEMIRNFIKDAYLNNGVRYVLLGGDGDGHRTGGETWDAIVPARGLWAWAYEPDPSCCIPPTESTNLLSDLYYACLEGNFDGNNNGIYGEPDDGVNLHANVYVGRAPVDNYEELSNFVRKTLAYESTSRNDPYLTAVWMIGEYLEPMVYPKTNSSDPEGQPPITVASYWGADYKNQTKTFFPAGFNIWTLYDKDYPGDDCNCNQNDWPRSELIYRINENYIHAINHIGTSNFCDIVAYVMKMGYNHADALNNTKYFFGYSQAGYAAAFDNRDPEGVYLPHDCVLEHFVTAPAGAFAFIGNSRYGLIDLSDINDSPSQKFDKAFWAEMFNTTRWNETNRTVTNIGLINQLSKETLIGEVGDPNMRYCYYEINLLGDPETPFLLPAAVTLGTTAEMPEAAEAKAPKAAPDTEKVTQVSPSHDMPDLFEDGMSFDAFGSGEMEFDFGGMDFGDSLNF
jgi:hypothetical protein